MTVPAASRQSVAVSRMLYSIVGALVPVLGAAEEPARPPGRSDRRAAWAAAINAGFDAPPRSPSPVAGRCDSPLADELSEPLAAGLEVAELVKARAGRREQHDLPGLGGRAGGGHRGLEIPTGAPRHPGR